MIFWTPLLEHLKIRNYPLLFPIQRVTARKKTDANLWRNV